MRCLILICFLISLFPLNSQKRYIVLFYNVENFFDVQDNPHTRDNEFLPEGKKHWSKYKMFEKNKQIGKIVSASGGFDIPVLVGLAEIESAEMGNLLTKASPLKDLHYSYLHQESQDRRGIDVMLLYRVDYYEPISTHYYPVEHPRDTNYRSRDILYSKGVLANDTVHVFVNHWPSKYGGAMKSAPLRGYAAHTLRKRTDSIMAIDPMAKIIIMGDFNDEAYEPSLVGALGAIKHEEPLDNKALVNLSWPLIDKGEGTYKYRAKWGVIDHMIVSKGMLEGEGLKTHKDGMKIMNDDFLLEEDKTYLGKKPKRTYIGYTYHGGCSDHLPVLLELWK
jgi:endonuclease/exonuclease/phosphatase family metal-dependent hydrolase